MSDLKNMLLQKQADPGKLRANQGSIKKGMAINVKSIKDPLSKPVLSIRETHHGINKPMRNDKPPRLSVCSSLMYFNSF